MVDILHIYNHYSRHKYISISNIATYFRHISISDTNISIPEINTYTKIYKHIDN
jgi:hypothetical protein